MNKRQAVILLFTIMPGLMVIAICAYFLLPEWVALEYSYHIVKWLPLRPLP